MSFSRLLPVAKGREYLWRQDQHESMEHTIPPLSFIHDLRFNDIPDTVRAHALNCILDLVGIGIGGSQTKSSRIITRHAHTMFGGSVPIPFGGGTASPAGAALAGAMTIDSLDGHDGFNPAKGHAGCGVLPSTLALCHDLGREDGQEFLTAIVIGYEIACRTAMAQHATCPDYHTSGAWVAVAVAAIGARLMGLDPEQTRHAMGIAEYHGPRSQMMRCIDHPTMVKDGSGWGAMAGVSAAYLARDGFTGAPALTVEQAPEFWGDLGQRWLILEQYFKPYPVCRWAQAPIEAVLELRQVHGLVPDEISKITIETFHESVRLATNTPGATDAAQYSTSYPCAVAMARGTVGPSDIADEALDDPQILRMSQAVELVEHPKANDAFPQTRYARAVIQTTDGRALQSRWHTPRWDWENPPTDAEFLAKFRGIVTPLRGEAETSGIEGAILQLPDGQVSDLALKLG